MIIPFTKSSKGIWKNRELLYHKNMDKKIKRLLESRCLIFL